MKDRTLQQKTEINAESDIFFVNTMQLFEKTCRLLLCNQEKKTFGHRLFLINFTHTIKDIN